MRAPEESRGIRVGTSGWSYAHWRGVFYPRELAASGWLEWYARHFSTVEINSSFYRLPRRGTFVAWRRQTPAGFVFAVKAGRYITHMKKLRDTQAATTAFLRRAEGLGEKLGPILFQLPPRWHCDLPRLERFLRSLPRGLRYAFELRDPSWHTARTYEVLQQYGAAHCLYHMGTQASPRRIAGPLVYLRLHGPAPGYRGSYDGRTLRGWVSMLRRWQAEGEEVFVYFDNDALANAVRDAARLQGMVAERSAVGDGEGGLQSGG